MKKDSLINAILYLLMLLSLVFNGYVVYTTIILSSTLGIVAYWLPFAASIVLIVLAVFQSYSEFSDKMLFLKSDKPFKIIYSVFAFIASTLILLANASILQSVFVKIIPYPVYYMVPLIFSFLLIYLVKFDEGIRAIINITLIQIVIAILLLGLTLNYVGGFTGLLYRVANVMINLFWPIANYPLYLVVLCLSFLFYLEPWCMRHKIKVEKTGRWGFVAFILGSIYSIALIYIGLTLSPYIIGHVDNPYSIILSVKNYSTGLFASLLSIIFMTSSLPLLTYSIISLRNILSTIIKGGRMNISSGCLNVLHTLYVLLLFIISITLKVNLLIDILIYFSPIIIITGIVLTIAYKTRKVTKRSILTYILICIVIYVLLLKITESLSISCIFSVFLSMTLTYLNPLGKAKSSLG